MLKNTEINYSQKQGTKYSVRKEELNKLITRYNISVIRFAFKVLRYSGEDNNSITLDVNKSYFEQNYKVERERDREREYIEKLANPPHKKWKN